VPATVQWLGDLGCAAAVAAAAAAT
jgi:hypothetical protein